MGGSPGAAQAASCGWAHRLLHTGRCRGCPDFPWMRLGPGWSSNTRLCGPGGCSRIPHPPSREGLCLPLAGRPHTAFGTPGSSLEQNSPQGSSLQATIRPTDSGHVPDEARGSQRSRESRVGQSGAPVKWLRSPGGNSRFLQGVPGLPVDAPGDWVELQHLALWSGGRLQGPAPPPAGRASAHHWQGGPAQHSEHQEAP